MEGVPWTSGKGLRGCAGIFVETPEVHSPLCAPHPALRPRRLTRKEPTVAPLHWGFLGEEREVGAFTAPRLAPCLQFPECALRPLWLTLQRLSVPTLCSRPCKQRLTKLFSKDLPERTICFGPGT